MLYGLCRVRVRLNAILRWQRFPLLKADDRLNGNKKGLFAYKSLVRFNEIQKEKLYLQHGILIPCEHLKQRHYGKEK